MFEKTKNFFNRRTVLVLWLAGFAYTWPVYNKYWAPYDEGIVAVAAQMILAGKIPYKDFFIIMYPPGQIYLLAALFKIFSAGLIAGRIYALLVSVASTMLVFFMSRRLTGNRAIAVFAWLVTLTSLGPRLGTIPAPIWPGVLLGLFSVYIFTQYLKNRKLSCLIASGLVSGAALTFRHDIGIFAMAAIGFSLLLEALSRKNFKDIVIFILSASAVVLPWAAYFMNASASKDMYNSLVLFPSIHQKTASLPFPKPCLDLNMIFHSSLQFITINQFYIPIVVYSFTALLILNRIARKKFRFNAGDLSITTILLFGIFTFNQARIRTDPAHLLTVIEPAIILFAVILQDTFSHKFELRTRPLIKYAVSALVIMLLVLLMVKNTDKYIKNTYTKAYKGNIIKTPFDKGVIFIPKEEADDVSRTVKFIKENTSKEKKIYIGNSVHWKDDFGGSLILYYLADRLPGVKYYELAPGLITNPDVQRGMKDSLIRENVKLLVLQDIDLEGLTEKDVAHDKLILDDFIRNNYRPVEKFGKFNIYKRK